MTRNPLQGSAVAGLAIALFGFPATLFASSVSSIGLPLDLETVGAGNMLTLLTVQANVSESGAVTWNGSSDVRAGDAAVQSFTRTTVELRGLGINGRSFGVVFSGNELPGGASVNLSNFTLRFFAPDGSTLFDAAYHAGPGESAIPSFGSDSQSGWLYRVSLSESEADLFFASDANRIGVLIDRNSPISGTSGGPESLALLHFDVMCDPQVPEPASLLVWLIGAGGALAVARRNRTALMAKS